MCWVVVKNFVQDPLEAAIVHDREHTEGAVVQLIGGNVTGEGTECPIQSPSIRASPFFPRRLDPVLNGGEGHEDTMVAPEMPGRCRYERPSSATNRTAVETTLWV
jgi:hypothetical protein